MANRGKSRKGGLVAALMALLAIFAATPSIAQSAPSPEEYSARDDRGVDMVTGSYSTEILEGRIGPDDGGVSLYRYFGRSGERDNWSGDLRRTNVGGIDTIIITFGQIAQRFTRQGGVWIPANGNGASLVEVMADREWIYRNAAGTVITY
jgi:hypothetical protein